MGGSSDSDSGSESGRSNRSFKKDKKDKKDKKEKKDKKHDSGDEHGKKDRKDKKDKKDKDKDKKDKDKDKDKKDKKDDKHKDDKHKDDKHKDDKHKDDKHKDEHKDKPSSQLPAQISHALSGTGLGGLAQEFLQGGGGHGLLREGGAPASTGPPKIPSNAPTGPGTGASGQRVPCTTTDPFPAQAAGPAPPFIDSTGQPAYVGSAIISGSNVQPCRITASGACFIAADGAEVQHSGRYDLLPLTDAMEWVQSSGGAPPAGRRVVEGGIENGSSLYHACARVNSVLLPGKAGPALGGAQIPAGGTASSVAQDYFVLCWRE